MPGSWCVYYLNCIRNPLTMNANGNSSRVSLPSDGYEVTKWLNNPRGALHLHPDKKHGATGVFLKSSWSLRPCLSDEFSNHRSGLFRHFDRREAFGTTAPLNVLLICLVKFLSDQVNFGRVPLANSGWRRG